MSLSNISGEQQEVQLNKDAEIQHLEEKIRTENAQLASLKYSSHRARVEQSTHRKRQLEERLAKLEKIKRFEMS